MGSLSALPALDVKTPQQPDLLQQFSQLQALKGNQQAMQQRAALAPLQQEAAQQNVQTGQLDIQQKQQQLKNQQALTQAYQTWDGRSYEDLAHLALKAGATGDAIQAIQQHGLTLRKTASDIAESDAKTGSDNATTLGKQLDQAAGALQGVLSAPPEQQGQALIATAQQLAQQKRPDGTPLLDAQHLQMAEQLAQQGPQAIATQVPIFAKSLTALSAQLESAQKAATTAKDTADANAKTAETNYYAQGGTSMGAPGVPVEQVQMRDWLAKNPGKGPSDYAIAMKKLVPGFTFALQQQAAQGAAAGQAGSGQPIDWNSVAKKYGLTPGAFDQQAEKYFSTGQLPSIGRSANAIAMNRDLMNRAADLHQGASLAENSAEYKSNVASLSKLQTNFDQVQAFEQTAEKNMDLLQKTAQNIPDLGARFANVPVRMITGSMIGTANMAAFKTALATAQTEAAKVLNSSNATGTLSDSSRHELQDIIDGNVPLPAMVASLNTLKQDMGNRTAAYQQQIGDIQKRLGGKAAAPSSGTSDFIMQGGHKFKVTARDANGKVTAADPVQ